jgi:hypothetical protein
MPKTDNAAGLHWMDSISTCLALITMSFNRKRKTRRLHRPSAAGKEKHQRCQPPLPPTWSHCQFMLHASSFMVLISPPTDAILCSTLAHFSTSLQYHALLLLPSWPLLALHVSRPERLDYVQVGLNVGALQQVDARWDRLENLPTQGSGCCIWWA